MGDKYGITQEKYNGKTLKRTRMVIDRVFGEMGLDDGIRLNPAFEKDMLQEFRNVDFREVDLTSRPLRIKGKNYSVVDGKLVIELNELKANSKSHEKTTYSTSEKGMVKSNNNVSDYLSGDKTQYSEIYSEDYHLYSKAGNEMSHISLIHNSREPENESYYSHIPNVNDYFSTAYKISEDERLEFDKNNLPKDFLVYTKIDRSAFYVELQHYYELQNKGENTIEWDGNMPIHPEHGIARLATYGQLSDMCQEKNLTTGEITPPQHPEWCKTLSPEILTLCVKESVGYDNHAKVLTNISPLQRRTLQELITLSNGRVAQEQTFMKEDYKAIAEGMEDKHFSEMLNVLTELTPETREQATQAVEMVV